MTRKLPFHRVSWGIRGVDIGFGGKGFVKASGTPTATLTVCRLSILILNILVKIYF
jgi:hypothetical protein